jgi:hypothetical protein
LNTKKSVVAAYVSLEGYTNLQELQAVDLRQPSAGVRVLGVPLGNAEYVCSELARVLVRVSTFCEGIIRLDHPQAGFQLLRLCTGACRVMHLMRAMPPVSLSALCTQVDAVMISTA